jgi:GNAT superfamily N-acetyltransferase
VNIVERARFKFERMHDIAEFSDEFSIDRINQHNFSMIEARLKLDLNSRFWPSKEDFLQNTLGAVIFHHTQPIGICYACAISNEIAEVDIYTDPSYRRQGVGQWVFAAFLQLCRERNITPHWDCYVNNIPSFDLATKLGFMPYHYYSHAIISQ